MLLTIKLGALFATNDSVAPAGFATPFSPANFGTPFTPAKLATPFTFTPAKVAVNDNNPELAYFNKTLDA